MMNTASSKDDPEPTDVDRDCAQFVRDALFPLRRDWGSSSSNNHAHGQIHPALMALDRLRTDLIDLRPSSTSYSNLFPRGVLLVPRSEALGKSTANGSRSMESNGQPDINEPNASLEVLPNLLTVKCVQCQGIATTAAAAFVRNKPKPSWKKDDAKSSGEHELILCSDRILKQDYYRRFGRGGNQRQPHRREDLPLQSMMAVEEVLARELTKLRVNGEDAHPSNSPIRSPSIVAAAAAAAASPPNKSATTDASCEAYAGVELLAARAAECLLVRKTDDRGRVVETRMGSALFPKSLYSVLPESLQRSFVDRCTYKVAARHTEKAAGEAGSNFLGTIPPRECVKRAWTSRHQKNNKR